MRRITKYSLLLSLVLGLYFPTVFAQSNMTNEMFDLAKLKSGVYIRGFATIVARLCLYIGKAVSL